MPNIKEQIEEQITNELKVVDYDTHEFTIEVILSKLKKGEIFIPPYQRKFVWNENKKSKFIESLLVNIPIPYLFLADTETGDLEIVDGVQRLLTIYSFCKNDSNLELPNLEYCKEELKLRNLEKLTNLNGKCFMDLIDSRRKRFLNKTIRAIVLTEKADDNVRFDLFERINTGSDTLKGMEKRRGAFQGKFTDFIKEIATNPLFISVLNITDVKKKRREDEELALRFFAYSDNYLNFTKSVQGFLDNYLIEKNARWAKLSDNDLKHEKDAKTKEIMNVLTFAQQHFANNFYKNEKTKQNSRVRFEALSVGTNLALRQNPNLLSHNINVSWINSNDFLKLVTTDGSNTKKRVNARIEFVKNKLLEK